MLKKLILIGSSVFALSSCTVYQGYELTSNNFGTKEGIARQNIFRPNDDFGFKKAADNGKITKIGAVEVKRKVFIFPFTVTKVYGE